MGAKMRWWKTKAPALPPRMRELVRLGTLAANGHNAQPWRFDVGSNSIAIVPDYTRRTAVVDPDDHHLFVSLGCASENMAIAGSGEVSYDAAAGAVRSLLPAREAAGSALAGAIERRQSSRSLYDGRGVSPDVLRALESCAYPGTHIVLVIENAKISRIEELIVEGNTSQMTDPAFRRELKRWIRFNRSEAKAKGDGLYAACVGSPSIPGFVGRALFGAAVGAKGENRKIRKQIASSAGLAVFYADAANHAHWARVGRSVQRFMLTATAMDVRCAFLNQPVEVAHLREALASLSGAAGYRPDLVLRFGHGPLMPRSFRRPVKAVIA